MLFVLFGATGDLAHQKLIPAIYRALVTTETDSDLVVLGTGRTEWSDDDFRERVVTSLVNDGITRKIADRWCNRSLTYQALDDATGLEPVLSRAADLERLHGLSGNRIYYLALPPFVFADTIRALGEARRAAPNGGWTRLVIEKPFGDSLESARGLNRLVHEYFAEEEIYRIDHYLGKDTVQNLLVFRFANAFFESIWGRNHIERVEITVAEEGGVDGRAGYYDRAGALRDMVQNHVMQLVCLTAMEVPAVFDADGIRTEKIKVLRSILPIKRDRVTFGQYEGDEQAAGYLELEGVKPDSETETFVALELSIQNWRWQGVPFLVRTGKRLPGRLTEIAVVFRRPPVHLFGGAEACGLHRNVLRIRLQPDEGFTLAFDVKQPGDGTNGALRLSQQHLNFDYAAAFGRIPDAYETLLRDLVAGDQTLFVHALETELAWALFQPLLESRPTVLPYPARSWGPEPARRLFIGGTAQRTSP